VDVRWASAGSGGTLEFHLGSASGPTIAQGALPVTGLSPVKVEVSNREFRRLASSCAKDPASREHALLPPLEVGQAHYFDQALPTMLSEFAIREPPIVDRFNRLLRGGVRELTQL
jgi:hypothetical protein